MIVLCVTDRDAFWNDVSRTDLAKLIIRDITIGINDYREKTSTSRILMRIFWILVVLVILFFGVKYMRRGLDYLNVKLLNRIRPALKGINFKNYEFLSAERFEGVILWVLDKFKWFIIILIVYLALHNHFLHFSGNRRFCQTTFRLYPNAS